METSLLTHHPLERQYAGAEERVSPTAIFISLACYTQASAHVKVKALKLKNVKVLKSGKADLEV